MLYLKKMPTDLDLAITLAYQLADHNVTGENFYSSGGLRVERAVTEGNFLARPVPNGWKNCKVLLSIWWASICNSI